MVSESRGQRWRGLEGCDGESEIEKQELMIEKRPLPFVQDHQIEMVPVS